MFYFTFCKYSCVLMIFGRATFSIKFCSGNAKYSSIVSAKQEHVVKYLTFDPKTLWHTYFTKTQLIRRIGRWQKKGYLLTGKRL